MAKQERPEGWRGFKMQPYDHQLDVLTRSNKKPAWALFMEMGTGKTKVIIDQAAWYHCKNWVDAVLVVAPKGVYLNWARKEIPAHWPLEEEPYVAWHTSYWLKADRLRLAGLYKAKDQLPILLVNVEALSNPKGQGLKRVLEFLNSFERVMFVLDESSCIKHAGSKRTKQLLKLSRHASVVVRRIMTGTPITQSPLDVYPQCEFLDKGLLGFKSFFAFKNRYAIIEKQFLGPNRSFNKVVGYQRLDELREKMRAFSSHHLKADCLDLPDKVYETRDVELTKAQRDAYDEMAKEAFIELEHEETVTAITALTKLQRLHQIVCGHTREDDDGLIRDIESQRDQALLDVLDEMTGKVIIWATFRYNLDRLPDVISKHFGVRPSVPLHGGISEKNRVVALDEFCEGDSQFLVANPQVGGFGLTLTAASNVIYYSNGYNLEYRLQSEDRTHRIGQENKVTYVDLIARDTVDEHVVDALVTKNKLAFQVLGDKWREWLGG